MVVLPLYACVSCVPDGEFTEMSSAVYNADWENSVCKLYVRPYETIRHAIRCMVVLVDENISANVMVFSGSRIVPVI